MRTLFTKVGVDCKNTVFLLIDTQITK